MLNQVLAYRRFVQGFRSERDRQNKLLELAGRMTGPIEENARAIYEAYCRGDDILDPDLFDREDILAFARKNGLLGDQQVLAAIEQAKTR